MSAGGIAEAAALTTLGGLAARASLISRQGSRPRACDDAKRTFAREELDCSMTQLALAWTLKNPNVTTVLLGATRVAQLEENLGAVAVARKLTDDHLAAIEEILGTKPEPWSGYGGAGMRALDTL